MGSSHVQGALLGAEARLWSETLEQTTRPLFEQVHDELGTGGGTGLLDAGWGTGLALQLAAGRGAEVAGIDASAGMSATARERNRDAELHEGDLEAIEHAGREATADAVRASLESSVQPDGTSVHRNAFHYLIATT